MLLLDQWVNKYLCMIAYRSFVIELAASLIRYKVPTPIYLFTFLLSSVLSVLQLTSVLRRIKILPKHH